MLFTMLIDIDFFTGQMMIVGDDYRQFSFSRRLFFIACVDLYKDNVFFSVCLSWLHLACDDMHTWSTANLYVCQLN